MSTTIYAVMNGSEDSMGCRCCKLTAGERIEGLFFDEYNAKDELKNLAKQDAEAGFKVKWSLNELSFESMEDGHVVHEFYIETKEVS